MVELWRYTYFINVGPINVNLPKSHTVAVTDMMGKCKMIHPLYLRCRF